MPKWRPPFGRWEGRMGKGGIGDRACDPARWGNWEAPGPVARARENGGKRRGGGPKLRVAGGGLSAGGMGQIKGLTNEARSVGFVAGNKGHPRGRTLGRDPQDYRGRTEAAIGARRLIFGAGWEGKGDGSRKKTNAGPLGQEYFTGPCGTAKRPTLPVRLGALAIQLWSCQGAEPKGHPEKTMDAGGSRQKGRAAYTGWPLFRSRVQMMNAPGAGGQHYGGGPGEKTRKQQAVEAGLRVRGQQVRWEHHRMYSGPAGLFSCGSFDFGSAPRNMWTGFLPS